MNDMKLIRGAIGLVAVLLISTAFKRDRLQPTSDEYVIFEIRNAGVTVEASFDEFETEIKYDPNNPSASSFSASISVSSINTGIDMRNDHLQEEEYFYQSKYPNITFKSTSTSVTDDGTWVVNGTLTIRGISKSITLKTKPEKKGEDVYFESSWELNRLDYKVGESSWIMGNDVLCLIRAKAD